MVTWKGEREQSTVVCLTTADIQHCFRSLPDPYLKNAKLTAWLLRPMMSLPEVVHSYRRLQQLFSAMHLVLFCLALNNRNHMIKNHLV